MNTKQDVYNIGKVAIIGDKDSGKTALVKRFIKDTFLNAYESTIGVNYNNKTINISNQNKVELQIWDCSGHERFRLVCSSYYDGVAVGVVCVNLTQLDSFKVVDDWIEEIRDIETKPKILLVGTKADLITPEEIEDRKKILEQKKQDLDPTGSFIIDVFITSAKTNENISLVFKSVGEIIVKYSNDLPKSTPVIIQSADNKIANDDEYDFVTEKSSFWQRHQRKIIAGIMIGTFVAAAITLTLTLPVVIPFLASMGLIIPFTGYAGMAALAGIGAAVGLVIGSAVAGITFGMEAIVRKLSRIGNVNVDNFYNEDDSLLNSASSRSESSSIAAADEQSPQSETIFPSPISTGYGHQRNMNQSDMGEQVETNQVNYVTQNNKP